MKTLKPSPRRALNKRISVHQLFGTVTEFPASYRAGNTLYPNQNADVRPNGCTSYSIMDGILNTQGITISHDFQYYKTIDAEGESTDGEVSIDTAFDIPPSIGVILASQEPSGISALDEADMIKDGNWPVALDNATIKIPPSIPVIRAPGQDWYDAIKNALLVGKAWNGVVAVGTQWSADFENIGSNGILPDNPANLYWGHCHNYFGWEVNADGVERLNDKTWQGQSYGDQGQDFASRVLVNKLMSAYGAEARLFTNQPAPQAQKLAILTVLIDFLEDLLNGVGNAVHQSLYVHNMV